MATELTMPKNDMDMEEGTIVKWLKNVGDKVEKGEMFMEIETDKTSMEIESPATGVLLAQFYQGGDVVPVNTVMGYVGEAGEKVPEQAAKGDAPAAEEPKTEAAASVAEKKENEYDVAVIGGGPAGYTAAERAAQGGLSTILFEKNALGGVCLNEGCVPTKTLLYSAKTYDNIKHASKYAVKAENPSFDLPKIIARKNKVVKKLTAGIRMKMTEHGVVMVTAEACIQGRAADGTITIAAGEELYEAANLLICTGSETVIPPIPGLAETEYWTSREALQSKELPASLVIIGGGVIGMEFASFFNSLGVEVHVVEMLDKILGPMDRELSEMLQAEYAKRGIKFYLSYKVTGVHGTEVSVEKDGETFTLHGDKVLLSVGRRPVTKGFGLETLAPETFRNGVKVNEYMQTSLPNVYACGDITAFSLLAHTAVSEAEVAVDHLLGKLRPMSYKAIPAVVYTNPEIAGVGKTEEELQAEGISYTVKKIPMAFSGRFVAENEMGNGVCKLILSEDETLIGAHMLGNPASELIVIAGIAIEKGMKSDELKSFVFPHPTVGEIIKEALY